MRPPAIDSSIYARPGRGRGPRAGASADGRALRDSAHTAEHIRGESARSVGACSSPGRRGASETKRADMGWAVQRGGGGGRSPESALGGLVSG